MKNKDIHMEKEDKDMVEIEEIEVIEETAEEEAAEEAKNTNRSNNTSREITTIQVIHTMRSNSQEQSDKVAVFRRKHKLHHQANMWLSKSPHLSLVMNQM